MLLNDQLSDAIFFSPGIWWGCILTPVLFNLYVNYAVKKLQGGCFFAEEINSSISSNRQETNSSIIYGWHHVLAFHNQGGLSHLAELQNCCYPVQYGQWQCACVLRVMSCLQTFWELGGWGNTGLAVRDSGSPDSSHHWAMKFTEWAWANDSLSQSDPSHGTVRRRSHELPKERKFICLLVTAFLWFFSLLHVVIFTSLPPKG